MRKNNRVRESSAKFFGGIEKQYKISKKNADSRMAILVNSCDSYEDLWYPYFELLRLNWKDCAYPIYLNTETKNYEHNIPLSQPIQIINYQDKAGTWSDRLLNTLRKISSDYVLFTLDDFFIHSKVDSVRIEEVLGYLESDPNIACFYLKPFKNPNNLISECYHGFELLDKKNSPMILQAQVAIWRKEKLIRLLRKSESPWELEEQGSVRASKSGWDFYAIDVAGDLNEKNAIIHYVHPVTLGYGLWQGKWLFKNKELFEKFGIAVDFSKRESFKSRDEVLEYLDSLKSHETTNNLFRDSIKKILPDAIIYWIRKIKSWKKGLK